MLKALLPPAPEVLGKVSGVVNRAAPVADFIISGTPTRASSPRLLAPSGAHVQRRHSAPALPDS